MNFLSIAANIFIAAGAIVMTINIFKSRSILHLLKQFTVEGYERLKLFISFHQILMIFFLFGYLIALFTIIIKINLIGELFVGIIFFFGAIFILLGILLESRMIASIRESYEQAKNLGLKLQKKQAQLVKGTDQLNEEIEVRKRTEEALKESEERIRATFDAIQVGILLIDPATHIIVDANSLAAEAIGTSKERLIGQECHDHICPAERGKCPITDLKQKIDNLECVLLSAKRDRIPILKTVVPVNLGGREHLLESFLDITERKETYEALRESEEKYRTILENIKEGYYEIDLAGNLTFFNDQFARILGYSRDELLGLNNRDFTSPETAKRLFQNFNSSYRTGNPVPIIEYEVIRKDGTIRIVEISATLIKDPSGESTGFRGIARDISERKRAEESMLIEKANLEQLFESAQEAIVMTDNEGRIMRVNTEFTSVFGYTCDEAIGQFIDDLVASKDLHEEASSITKRAAKGERVALETIRQHKDGTQIKVSVLASPIIVGEEPVACYAIYRDITEVKQAEEALRESEERYRSVMEAAPDPIVVYDIDGLVNYLNPAFTSTFGWTMEESLGKRMDFVPEENVPETNDAIKRMLRGESIRSLETRRFTKDGDILDVHVSASTFIGRDGKPAGNIVILRDVTERNRMVVELRQAKEAAEAASRSKSTFLANMSHELRTPLNAIIGYSEMLAEDAEDAGQKNYIPDLQKIQAAGKHLLTLLNEVLDLSKVEAGKMELYLETFDVSSMVDQVMSTIQPLAEQNANSLEVRCGEDLGTMHADLTKVRQTLYNLLSNACKFTEHGNILLDAARKTVGSIDWLIFNVRDTGVGMTTEQMDRLFQPFSQADASTGHDYGGTGLGLAISKRFCKIMGGDITAESEYGTGTTFTIRLPSEVADIKAVKVSDNESRFKPLPEGSNMVLVIDDNPTVRELLKRYLNKEGYQVETASGGEEGLRLAGELHPDAITLDVLMPGMDGWSVLTALKANPQLADIPVIMLTIVDDKNMGYRLGASEYFTKPIDRNRLVAVLQRYTHHPSRVLIIEDDAATREMLRRMLEKEGWIVTEAENGRVAMERIAETQPAFILLDLMMPEMDGFEFVDELRKHKDWCTIPVAVITAKNLTSEERDRLRGCVEKILQKGSCTREELLAEVRDLVSAVASTTTAVKT
jgi:PAS domain S-box-containing protein